MLLRQSTNTATAQPLALGYFLFLFYFMGTNVSICRYGCIPLVHLVPTRPEESRRSPGTEVTGSCELSLDSWVLGMEPGEKSALS